MLKTLTMSSHQAPRNPSPHENGPADDLNVLWANNTGGNGVPGGNGGGGGNTGPSYDYSGFTHDMSDSLAMDYGMEDGGGMGSSAGGMAGNILTRQSSSSGIRSNNVTEVVKVPSSEHVAEIVGRQGKASSQAKQVPVFGCKIKALRAKTGTYIKTPVRGEEPSFVVTGKATDVAHAKREILSAAEHFTNIRATRQRNGVSSSSAPGPRPGEGGGNRPVGNDVTSISVKVPYSVVGLIVGPRGATIKKIQAMTNTYIVTPSRERDPVFEIQGSMENVEKARIEIASYINQRTRYMSSEDPQSMYEEGGHDMRLARRHSRDHSQSGERLYDSDGPNGSLAEAVNSLSRPGQQTSNIWSAPEWSSNRSFQSPFGPFGVSNGGGSQGSRRTSTSNRPSAFDFAQASDDTSPGPSAGHAPLSQTRSEPIGGRNQMGFNGYGASSTTSGVNSPATPAGGPFGLFGPIGGAPSLEQIRATSSGSAATLADTSSGSNSASQSASNSGGNTPLNRQPGSVLRVCSLCRGPREIDFALVPCGHNLYCQECALSLVDQKSPCPACQETATSALRLRS